MDLNASPAPEEDEEEVFDGHIENGIEREEHTESAVDIFRREREERRRRLNREHTDDGRSQRNMHSYRNDPGVPMRSHRFYDRSRLPHGWLDCPSYGQAIDYIVPSKVPLGETFNDSIPPGKRYSFRQVIHQQRVLGRDLGMVIDLTNTTRYYPTSDLKRQGIKHVKISCRGRDAVPDNASVNEFVYEVSQFCSRLKHSKKFILVHCTHGHNRTGFMIVHYLMRTRIINVTEAIQLFANARPPGIYKKDYINSLYSFYHENRPETVICPSTPEWKRSSELDLNGEAVQDEDDDGGISAPSQEEHIEHVVMTNDDVLGDAIHFDQQKELQQKCYELLKLPQNAIKGNLQFPGSHPVSLNRENLQLLRQRYYYATWKADGTRYMMLITHDGCYLIDRNFCFRRVQLRFPLKHSNENNSGVTHHLTLLDGEMVIDTMPGKQTRRYLIYDLMAVGGQPITERPFCERWKFVEREVIEPRVNERKYISTSRNPYYRYDLEPFSVRRKDFWLLSTVTKVLKEFIPSLSHAADGLIFQGWDDSYVTRTHMGLLKWKYPEMNSVDFLFEVEDSREKMFLFERGQKKLMEGNRVLFKGVSDVSIFSGKIIECSWDVEEQSWIFMRVRVDKSTPNEFNTYRKVLRSIKDNITEEVLLKEIGEIVSLPMYADRKPPVHHQQGARRK